ncbi:MAG: BamA/TamA family outer membrane protein [Candidatus Krumholzibacteriota bacterium]|nr:BamA/TamA family outer membrane protein [Candidatus Krumholzibacteriota bacterium]
MKQTRFKKIFQGSSLLVLLLALIVPPAGALPAPSANGSAARILHLEKIVVSGNKQLKSEALLQTLNLGPGDTLNVTLLERERLRLLDIHPLLTEVNFYTRPGRLRGAIILDIQVEERSKFAFETGYGYHETRGWFLTLLGMRVNRLYHTDSNLRCGIRLGFNLAGLDAEWEKPPVPDGRIGYGAKFYFYSENQHFFGSGPAPTTTPPGTATYPPWEGPDWHEFRQKIERTGLEISLRYRVGGTRFKFGARTETIRPDSTFFDVEGDLTRPFSAYPSHLKPEIDKTLITGLFFRITRDTRDHVVYPRSGSFTLLSLETNNTVLGGDEVFTKVIFDFRRHLHRAGERVLSYRLHAGITSAGAPYYERFSLGGIYSLRGFREWSLSPARGDDGFWITSAEYRVPLIPSVQAPPRLAGLVFFDAGQGWQRGRALAIADLQSAAGYGIRLRIPWLGTLGIDTGIPLSRGRTGEKFYVHGSIGFSF